MRYILAKHIRGNFRRGRMPAGRAENSRCCLCTAGYTDA